MNFCGRCETTHFLSLERFHGILAILICLSGWTGSRWPMARTTQLTHTGSPPSDEPPLSCRKILGSQNYIALTVAVEHDGSMPASREVAPLPGDRSARAESASL